MSVLTPNWSAIWSSASSVFSGLSPVVLFYGGLALAGLFVSFAIGLVRGHSDSSYVGSGSERRLAAGRAGSGASGDGSLIRASRGSVVALKTGQEWRNEPWIDATRSAKASGVSEDEWLQRHNEGG